MSDQAKISEPFTKMAERMDRNAEESFGGAFVIVPPPGAGETMQALMLTSTDPATFYIMLKSQIEKALAELQAPLSPYGRPR